MSEHRWTELRVIHGPVVVNGRIARVIEAKDNRGGVLTSTEVWDGEVWYAVADGLGRSPVLNAPLAPHDALVRAGVPTAPFPTGYNPARFKRK